MKPRTRKTMNFHSTILATAALSLAALPARADTAAAPSSAPVAAEVAPASSAITTRVGERLPAAGFPRTWLRGAPANGTFEPGKVYLVTVWEPFGFFGYPPGRYLGLAVTPELARHPSLRLACVAINAEGHGRAAVERILRRPSFRCNPYAVAMADDAVWGNWFAGFATQPNATLVVRDGVLLWQGFPDELSEEHLAQMLEADYDPIAGPIAWEARQKAEQKLFEVGYKDLNALASEGRYDEFRARLAEFSKREDAPVFLRMHWAEMDMGLALMDKDIPRAIAVMKEISDRNPRNEYIQSRVVKVVNATSQLREVSSDLQIECYRLMAPLKPHMAEWESRCLEAAAQVQVAKGDKLAAAATYEDALSKTPLARRLAEVKAGR